MKWQEIIFEYVCPSLGCLLAAAVFAAPIHDLNQALRRGSLDSLNTVPWCVMTGNCLGWCAYAYYTKDPFVLASNLPGLILSLWLNIGACKLQYLGQIDASRSHDLNENIDEDCTEPEESIPHKKGSTLSKQKSFTSKTTNSTHNLSLNSSPQDVLLLRVLCGWAFVLVCVGWLDGLWKQVGAYYEPQKVVGVLVNINLVFFYGAPLQTMKIVLASKSADSIHTPTVTRNVTNAIFWMSYGLARKDIIIYGPNGVGLVLGLVQCVLCCLFPKRGSKGSMLAVPQSESEYTFELTSVSYSDTDDDANTLSSLQKRDQYHSSIAERRVV